MTRVNALYVTFDGVLRPLGFSQVVRTVVGLARRGLNYALLSVERPVDLEKRDLREKVRSVLHSNGVPWTTIPAASMSSPRRAAQVATQGILQAALVVRRRHINLVHARGYHGALVAAALKRLLGLAYVFDARGYWIEERTGPNAWFSTAQSYAAGKFIEQLLFRSADAVVTLTQLQATDLASGLFGPPPRLLEVIPTCADYEAFFLRPSRPAKPDGGGCVPSAIQRRLSGKRVVAIVGALNRSYHVEETMALVKFAMKIDPTIHLLVLSEQFGDYEAALRSMDFTPDRYTLSAVDHTDMPEWLQWIDWGMLLLPETAAKRASMPTKLAEFFATGVRPMFFGCNSEAAHWVERAGSGYVLPSIGNEALRDAARFMSDSKVNHEQLHAARQVTSVHFGLASCVDRYAGLLGACVPGETDDVSRSRPADRANDTRGWAR